MLNPMISKIANQLGLAPEADIIMITEGIITLQSTVEEEKEKTLTALQDVVKNQETTAVLQKRYDELLAEMKVIMSAMEKEEEENRAVQAKEMVNGFARMGKIENTVDTIASWTDLAKGSKEQLEKIRDLLTGLPVNKEAAKIQTVVSDTSAGAKNLSQRMYALAKKHGQS